MSSPQQWGGWISAMLATLRRGDMPQLWAYLSQMFNVDGGDAFQALYQKKLFGHEELLALINGEKGVSGNEAWRLIKTHLTPSCRKKCRRRLKVCGWQFS